MAVPHIEHTPFQRCSIAHEYTLFCMLCCHMLYYTTENINILWNAEWLG